MYFVKIPKERIGVLIGPEGATRRQIEERSGIKVSIDSSSGDVALEEEKAKDPVLILKVRDIVKAIARGFSPERAFVLFDDEMYFDSIDIREYSGKEAKDAARLKGRIIGKQGKTREIIEQLAHAEVSVYGSTVSLIADIESMEVARNAVQMLLKGSEHSTVYRYLEKMCKKMRKIEL
ncbi:MAG: KH domain-containing protein [Candidatus Thermoplasmatota archaeon]|nr:KH domain-containing protein [Candidatus Thermoplasmatota archaeon]